MSFTYHLHASNMAERGCKLELLINYHKRLCVLSLHYISQKQNDIVPAKNNPDFLRVGGDDAAPDRSSCSGMPVYAMISTQLQRQ